MLRALPCHQALADQLEGMRSWTGARCTTDCEISGARKGRRSSLLEESSPPVSGCPIWSFNSVWNSSGWWSSLSCQDEADKPQGFMYEVDQANGRPEGDKWHWHYPNGTASPRNHSDRFVEDDGSRMTLQTTEVELAGGVQSVTLCSVKW